MIIFAKTTATAEAKAEALEAYRQAQKQKLLSKSRGKPVTPETEKPKADPGENATIRVNSTRDYPDSLRAYKYLQKAFSYTLRYLQDGTTMKVSEPVSDINREFLMQMEALVRGHGGERPIAFTIDALWASEEGVMVGSPPDLSGVEEPEE